MEEILFKIFGTVLEGIGYFLRRIYYLFFAGSYEEADRQYKRKKKKILFGYVMSPNQLTGLLAVFGLLILYILLF